MISRTTRGSRIRVSPELPRGFTLLELLLVLALIGIAVATVIPNLTGTLGEWQVRETARDLQATLQLASQWARVRQEAVLFVLDVPRGVFSLRCFRDGQATDRAVLPLGQQALGRNVTIVRTEGLRDDAREKVLAFGPAGASGKAILLLTDNRAVAAPYRAWQVDVDEEGNVHCQERLVDENEQ
jgi:type II secretion system protein H